MAMAAPLQLRRSGSIATITLDRPETGNAIDVPMAEALLQAALECASDLAVRCVVLTGAGPMFCAGGDIKGFAQADDVGALIERITASLHMAIARLARMDKPLVTAINGAAAGAGFGLALLGDVALAARRSSRLLTGHLAFRRTRARAGCCRGWSDYGRHSGWR